MPEHVHILLLPMRDEYSMEQILKSIKPVAQKAMQFLKEHAPEFLPRLAAGGRRHHTHQFWEAGGGYDRNIHTAQTAWASVHYIHNNPVTRSLTDHPRDWPWSSASWYEGHEDVKLAMDACPPDP